MCRRGRARGWVGEHLKYWNVSERVCVLPTGVWCGKDRKGSVTGDLRAVDLNVGAVVPGPENAQSVLPSGVLSSPGLRHPFPPFSFCGRARAVPLLVVGNLVLV